METHTHTFMGVAVQPGTLDPVTGDATPSRAWIVTPTTSYSTVKITE